jgi:PAS domain S-box-containing protein
MDAPVTPSPVGLTLAEQARLLAEQSREIVFRYRVAPQQAYEYVSPACSTILGYQPEEFYANPCLGSELLFPEDRALLCKLSTNGPGPHRLRLRYLHRDGHMVWIDQQLRVSFDAAGQPQLIEGSGCDISASVAVETQLKLLSTAIEAAGNAVVISDIDGTIRWVNPAFSRMTGYSAAEAIGATTRLLKSGRHEPHFYQELWTTILAGRPWSGELMNRRKDGSLYYEEQTITPVIIDGEVRHFVAIKQDVSTRFQRDREREAMLVMAAALRTARTRAEMLPALLSQTMVLLRAQGAAIALHDKPRGEPLCELGAGVWEHLSGQRLGGADTLTRRVIESGRTFRGAPPLELAGELPIHEDSAACVPLRAHDMVIGALWIIWPQQIENVDLRLLAGIADMAANAILRTSLFEQTERRLQRLTGLHTIDQAITAGLDQHMSLRVLIEQTHQQLDVDVANVLLLSDDTERLDYHVGCGLHEAFTRSVSLHDERCLAGIAVRERRRILVEDLSNHHDLDERHHRLVTDGFRAYVVTPLVAQGQVLGVLEVFQRAALHPDPEWLDYLDTLAGRAAVAIDNAELFGRLQRSNNDLALAYDTTLEGWSRALDLRDKETEGHSQRVTELTVRLAHAMGLSESEIVHIRRGALLHDIGKMGIPDAILLKPGPLDDDEWSIMRRHPSYGYALLAPIAHLSPALDIPYCHHEKWDGSGYPRGLAGEAIPLAARIFAVVDVWDALRSNRPYRSAWDAETVRAFISSQAGKHFDPQVVAAFLELELE